MSEHLKFAMSYWHTMCGDGTDMFGRGTIDKSFGGKTPMEIYEHKGYAAFELMEKLGVYWCLVYGNHDTDEHAMLNRDEASDLYMDKEKYPHCLLQKGPEDIDGVGNYIINIENSRDEIIQSLVMVDSNAYVERHLWGMIGKYDCVHKNQVEWYENQIVALTEKNGGKTPKSMVVVYAHSRNRDA
mgnify:CR=1 FL=1